MSKVEGGFSIIALLDGTTLNGSLRILGTPFIQKYEAGTSVYYPDFSPTAEGFEDENIRPTAVVLIRSLATGEVLTPSSYKFSYNETELTFETSTSDMFNGKLMCTTEGYEDVFELIKQYQQTFDGTTYYLPAIRVWNNLVPIGSANNDRLAVSGTVEINGQQISFSNISHTVIIQETSGKEYTALIVDNKGGVLTDESTSATCTCNVYFNGALADIDLTTYSFKWYKISGEGEVNLGKTTQSITVAVEEIDSLLKLRCDVFKQGTLIASANHQLIDNTDEYYVDFGFTCTDANGNNVKTTGNSIRAGQTMTITPTMRKRSDGTEATKVSTWSWTILDNAGSIATQTTGTSLSLTYTQISNYGGGITGSVSGSW